MNLVGVTLTANDSTPQFTPGVVYTHYNGNKYRYVKLLNESATVAGVAGDVVGYLGSPGATENYTVVTDNTDAATKPVGAGVLLTTVTGATGTAEYVWVQISGPATVNQAIAGSTPADGDSLYLSTTDKTLTLAAAADDPICAQATDVDAKKIVCLFP